MPNYRLRLEILSFLSSLLLPIFVSNAQIQSIELKNLNTTLRNYRGEIRFSTISAYSGDAHFEYRDGIIDVDKRNHQLHFLLDGARLALKNLNDKPLEPIRNSHLKDFQFSWKDQHSLDVKFDELGLNAKKGMERIKNLNIRCRSEKTRHKGLKNFFVPCFKSGKLTLPGLEIEQDSSIPRRILGDPSTYHQLAQNYARRGRKSTRTNVKLEDIKLTISNYTWKLRAQADTVFDVKVKGKGEIQFIEDERLLKVHIKKFEAGFIDIKDKILNAVKDLDSKKISVKGNSIHVDLSLE